MATLTSSEFSLDLDDHETGRSLGVLTITGMRVIDANPKGFRLDVQPSAGRAESPASLRWIAFTADLWSAQPVPRRYGSIDVPVNQRPALAAGQQQAVHWLWTLPADELELLERDRASAPDAPISLRLAIHGIAEVDGVVWGVWGEGSMEIHVSEWITDTTSLGYLTPPSVLNLVGNAASSDPAWTQAEGLLAQAREFLRAGEGAEALTSAFRAFDAVTGQPYDEDDLDDLVRHLPAQKRGAIKRLLAAQAAYLTTMARHPSFDRDPAGYRVGSPLDHWEAEIAVATAQLLLTYALRVRAEGQRDAAK